MSNLGKKEEATTSRRDFVPTTGAHEGSQDDFDTVPSAPSINKSEVDDVELGPRATYINTGAAAGLSQEHRDYLLARHGTLELDPIPDMGDQDPFNWPTWKVSLLEDQQSVQCCST